MVVVGSKTTMSATTSLSLSTTIVRGWLNRFPWGRGWCADGYSPVGGRCGVAAHADFDDSGAHRRADHHRGVRSAQPRSATPSGRLVATRVGALPQPAGRAAACDD